MPQCPPQPYCPPAICTLCYFREGRTMEEGGEDTPECVGGGGERSQLGSIPRARWHLEVGERASWWPVWSADARLEG